MPAFTLALLALLRHHIWRRFVPTWARHRIETGNYDPEYKISQNNTSYLGSLFRIPVPQGVNRAGLGYE